MFTKCSRVHIIDISIYYTVPVLVPFVLHLLLGNIDAVCMLILDNIHSPIIHAIQPQ